jgi:hypothetical protein
MFPENKEEGVDAVRRLLNRNYKTDGICKTALKIH